MISVVSKANDSGSSYVLQSSELEVSIVPVEGGRIASLRSVHSNTEFFTQARSGRKPIKPGLRTSFQSGPCAGAEECLPTVGPCEDCTGGPAPDHGDFWQIPWSVDSYDGEQLCMHAIGFSRPLRFARNLRVDGASLDLDYEVTNIGSEILPFLYAWHPLFVAEEGDWIVLPEEVGEVKLSYSRAKEFGSIDSRIMWPIFNDGSGNRDLSKALAPDAGTAEMVYTQELSVGRCGLFRKQRRQGIILSFDPTHLPYLGIWTCFGGWPSTGDEPKQVAIALEPTIAPFNTLSEAEHASSAVKLEPGKNFRWNLRIELISAVKEPGEFYTLVQQSY